MRINWDQHRDEIIKAARLSASVQELTSRARKITGESVTEDMVRSVWRRWQQRWDIPEVTRLVGADVAAPVVADAPPPPDLLAVPDAPAPAKSAQRVRVPSDEQPESSAFLRWADEAQDGDVFKVIVVPDMQVPYEDKRAVAAVEAYMADERWDAYINLGDFLDLDCISHHNKAKLRQIEGKTVAASFDAGNVVLDRHQVILRKNNRAVEMTLLEGNHDFRVERYIDEFPQLRGVLEVEHGLRLRERGIGWVRCYERGDTFKLGHAYFHHGLYCGGNHAKKMVDSFGVNIFYGHVHDVMQHPKVVWGKDKTLVGQSMGCLCDYRQSYIVGNPSNWQHAFGVFYFMPSGDFTYYVPRIIDYKFVAPNGRVYRA